MTQCCGMTATHTHPAQTWGHQRGLASHTIHVAVLKHNYGKRWMLCCKMHRLLPHELTNMHTTVHTLTCRRGASSCSYVGFAAELMLHAMRHARTRHL